MSLILPYPCSIQKQFNACTNYTTKKVKFSIKDFFSKCDQIRKKLPNWSHLL